MTSLTIFLDASVILSGLASPTGGSRSLYEAAKRRKILLRTTPFVIQEVVNHLQKLDIDPRKLRSLLSTKTLQLIFDPPEEMIAKFRQVISDPWDAHVLAGAVLSRASVLVSLDKKHILTPLVRRMLHPIRVNSPKEFWKWLRTRS